MSFESALLLLLVTSPALLVECSKGFSEDDSLRPPVPAWPEVFSVQFYVYVQQYGAEWNSTGVMFYHWASQVRCPNQYINNLHGIHSIQNMIAL